MQLRGRCNKVGSLAKVFAYGTSSSNVSSKKDISELSSVGVATVSKGVKSILKKADSGSGSKGVAIVSEGVKTNADVTTLKKGASGSSSKGVGKVNEGIKTDATLKKVVSRSSSKGVVKASEGDTAAVGTSLVKVVSGSSSKGEARVSKKVKFVTSGVEDSLINKSTSGNCAKKLVKLSNKDLNNLLADNFLDSIITPPLLSSGYANLRSGINNSNKSFDLISSSVNSFKDIAKLMGVSSDSSMVIKFALCDKSYDWVNFFKESIEMCLCKPNPVKSLIEKLNGQIEFKLFRKFSTSFKNHTKGDGLCFYRKQFQLCNKLKGLSSTDVDLTNQGDRIRFVKFLKECIINVNLSDHVDKVDIVSRTSKIICLIDEAYRKGEIARLNCSRELYGCSSWSDIFRPEGCPIRQTVFRSICVEDCFDSLGDNWSTIAFTSANLSREANYFSMADLVKIVSNSNFCMCESEHFYLLKSDIKEADEIGECLKNLMGSLLQAYGFKLPTSSLQSAAQDLLNDFDSSLNTSNLLNDKVTNLEKEILLEKEISEVKKSISFRNIDVLVKIPFIDWEFTELSLLGQIRIDSSQYIPNCILPLFRQTFTYILSTINAAVNDGNEAVANLFFKKKMLFNFVVLTFSKNLFKGPKKNIFSKKSIYKQRLQRILDDDWDSFTFDYFFPDQNFVDVVFPSNKNNMVSSEQKQNSIFKRASKLVSVGMISKGYRCLEPTSLAKSSKETIDALKLLHPKSVEILEDTNNFPREFFTFNPDSLREVIRADSRCVTPGLSGTKNEFYRQLMGFRGEEDGENFLYELNNFIENYANNKLSPEANQYMSFGSLIALEKENGVRPIAMGEYDRKLAGSNIKLILQDQLSAFFNNIQVGVGVPGGSEKIINSVKIAMDLFKENDTVCFDFKNAFNSVLRKQIIAQVKLFFPSLLSYLEACYGSKSPLFMKSSCFDDFLENIIFSEEGVQQGDVLGPLLFAIAVHHLLISANDMAKSFNKDNQLSGFCLGYIDDLTANGKMLKMIEVIKFLINMGPPSGLFLNLDKCVVLMGVRDTPEEAELDFLEYVKLFNNNPNVVKIHPTNLREGTLDKYYGCKLLGCPIGSDLFIKSWLDEKMKKLNNESSKLIMFEDNHPKWIFLSKVFANKISFLQRVIEPRFFDIHCSSMDNMCRRIFSSIIGSDVSDVAWHQVVIPISEGGFGLNLCKENSFAAYLASFGSTFEFTSKIFEGYDLSKSSWYYEASCCVNHINSFINLEEEKLSLENSINAKIKNCIFKQKFYSSFEQKARSKQFFDLVSNSDPLSQARLKSLGCEHAGDFLSVGSTGNSSAKFTGLEFTIACCFRLGLQLPIISKNTRCICAKAPLVGNMGQHLHTCPIGGERLEKHNAIVKEFCALSVCAGVAVKDKFLNVLAVSDSQKRPDIKFMAPKFNKFNNVTRDVLGDINITHPCNLSSVGDSSKKALAAAKKGASNKNSKYVDLCQKAGFDFIPLIFETFGAIHQDAFDVIVELATKHSMFSRIPKGVCIQYWFSRFSVSLQVHNARMFISKVARINNRNILSYASINPGFLCSSNVVINESLRDEEGA